MLAGVLDFFSVLSSLFWYQGPVWYQSPGGDFRRPIRRGTQPNARISCHRAVRRLSVLFMILLEAVTACPLPTRAALQRVQLEPGHHVKLRPSFHHRETEAQRSQVTSPRCFTRTGLGLDKRAVQWPPRKTHATAPHLHVFDQSLWGYGMSWTVIWGGVENKMSSCGCSQLPAGQGSLPPTVQPALCQGLLPATLQAAGTPKLLGPPPSPLVALAQCPTPVGLGAQTVIRQ